MWYTILQFVNYIGVITNAFLVGLTSSFGRGLASTFVYPSAGNSTVLSNVTTSNVTASSTHQHDTVGVISVTSYENLWIIIAFEVTEVMFSFQ